MKDIFSAFGTEVFRPLVTLILPGAVAVAPYFVGLMQKWMTFYTSVDANHTETAFLLFLLALFVGLVIEDIGAQIEDKILDERKKAKDTTFEQIWWAYLTCVFPIEPPGRRYLRALVMRLKFELGASVGLVLSIPGVLFVIDLGVLTRLGIVLGASLVAGYLGCVEAPSTHDLLANVRAHLVTSTVPQSAASQLAQ